MKAIITICSREKDHAAGLLPAIQRYTSSRIRAVYDIAEHENVRFFILSGKYGLLSPSEPIPDYDHLLQPEEVTSLARRVGAQLQALGVTDIDYYYRDDPMGRPYTTVLETAAQARRVALALLLIDSVGGAT